MVLTRQNISGTSNKQLFKKVPERYVKITLTTELLRTLC